MQVADRAARRARAGGQPDAAAADVRGDPGAVHGAARRHAAEVAGVGPAHGGAVAWPGRFDLAHFCDPTEREAFFSSYLFHSCYILTLFDCQCLQNTTNFLPYFLGISASRKDRCRYSRKRANFAKI